MTKKSPVVCWQSKWIKTGEVERLKLDDGGVMLRPVKRLEFKYNPAWKPRVKITK
jgi:hypothetical protein